MAAGFEPCPVTASGGRRQCSRPTPDEGSPSPSTLSRKIPYCAPVPASKSHASVGRRLPMMPSAACLYSCGPCREGIPLSACSMGAWRQLGFRDAFAAQSFGRASCLAAACGAPTAQANMPQGSGATHRVQFAKQRVLSRHGRWGGRRGRSFSSPLRYRGIQGIKRRRWWVQLLGNNLRLAHRRVRSGEAVSLRAETCLRSGSMSRE